jgi:hypothetical protein
VAPQECRVVPIAPIDFYPFGNMKERLVSVAVTRFESVLSAIAQVFSETQKDEFIVVDQKWMK